MEWSNYEIRCPKLFMSPASLAFELHGLNGPIVACSSFFSNLFLYHSFLIDWSHDFRFHN